MLKRAVAGILLVTLMLTGCRVWRVQQVSPTQAVLQAVADTVPHDVRVRLRADNSAWVIQHAQIVDDSIVGILKPQVRDEHARRIAFAVADIRDVAVSAQQPPQLKPGQRVLVTAPSAGLTGAIATVEALSVHDITLRRERLGHGGTDTLQMVPLDSVRYLQVSRRHGHAGIGALIGFAVGAIGGVIEVARENAQARTNFLKFSPIVGALFGLPGAGIGAIVGALVRTEEWVPVDLHRLRLGLVPQSGGRLGIGALLAL
jgi:hypothetical protein